MSKVYSYLRFSSAKQAQGTSASRQAEYAARWAAEHGMALDASLSMRDEGLSAYSQAHVKTGALGIFLAAVRDGKIPDGSVLIVEGLDRLSRAEPMVAQPQLAQIINAGITVVTAADNKTYSRESLKSNPMDLLYSLLVMIRAHEESETKSKRVLAASARLCERWQAGTFKGRISIGRDPSWLVWDGVGFKHLPDRVAAIRIAVRMYLDGCGFVLIDRELARAGLAISGGKARGYIYYLLRNPALTGTRVVSSGGVEYSLEGYYPPVLSKDEYTHLQVEMGKRSDQTRYAGGKGIYPGLFSGTGVGVCGHCGGRVVTQNQNNSLKDGTPVVYRKYRCGGACYDKGTASRGHRGSIPSLSVEKVILDYCSDQINLQSLMLSSDNIVSTLRAELVAAREALQDAERRGEKLMEVMLAADGGTPQMLLKKAREVEVEIASRKDAVLAIDARLSVASQVVDEDIYAQWRSVREGVLNLDYTARLKCRQLIADTFKRVTIYFSGLSKDSPHDAADIVLVSKSGNSRWLTFNRATGDLVRGLNLDKDRGEIGGQPFN